MAVVHWPVELQHGQVGLRPLRSADGSDWSAARQRNISWLRPWDATQPPGVDDGARTFRAMARDWNRQARYGRMLPFVITYGGAAGVSPSRDRQVHGVEVSRHVRAKWPLVGQLMVSGITYGSARWANLGYWVDEQYAGRGIVSTAVALAADHCWFTLGLHRMEVAIRPENKASLRVVEKLGFRYEGERPHFLHIDGEWRDHLIFALNAEEVGPGLVARLA